MEDNSRGGGGGAVGGRGGGGGGGGGVGAVGGGGGRWGEAVEGGSKIRIEEGTATGGRQRKCYFSHQRKTIFLIRPIVLVFANSAGMFNLECACARIV